MLRLGLDRQPRWVTLNCGVELLVAPITTAISSRSVVSAGPTAGQVLATKAAALGLP